LPSGCAACSFHSTPWRFSFAPRARTWLLLCHCVTASSLPAPRLAACGPALFSTPWRFSFSPRAMSGRSGCASSAALRPAFACDRAGTARRADPRCSPPSHEALGRGQRLHPPVWPLGARTLRRHGSIRPRGGVHHHPPACADLLEPCRQTRHAAVRFRPTALREGGIQSARRVPAAMPPSTAGTQRADHDGVSVTPPLADTEGPRHGTRCWVAVEGVSARSERGRASDEEPRTRLAKESPRGNKKPHAVKKKTLAAHPLGK
jgi:hypothetical protein